MTQQEQEWLSAIKNKPHLKQWEMERACRLMGVSARQAVKDLPPYPIHQRHYQYDTEEFLAWAKTLPPTPSR